jgi:hypothetical protein
MLIMDLAAVGAAVSSLRAAGDIAKGLISLHTMAEVQAKAIELNEKIIDAQHRIFETNAAQSELIERVRELEGQIARMKDWDAQRQRYKLAAPFAGCMVYAVQKAMSEGEPAHYLCAACFKKGKPSVLQSIEGSRGKGGARSSFYCRDCGSEAFTGYGNAVAPQYFEDIAAEA